MIFNSFRNLFSNSCQLSNKNWWKVAIACLSLMMLGAGSATAAEEIILNYGVLEFSVSIAALETYAKTGKLE